MQSKKLLIVRVKSPQELAGFLRFAKRKLSTSARFSQPRGKKTWSVNTIRSQRRKSSNDSSNISNKRPQTTNTVLMVAPNAYAGWNEEAATDNTFMASTPVDIDTVKREFTNVTTALTAMGVRVIVAPPGPAKTPDSIFPNNWLSTHDGVACLYPMAVPNRRLEVRSDILGMLKKGGIITSVIDFTHNTDLKPPRFLEGTGALVLDRTNKIAYCSLSQRVNHELVEAWAKEFGYKLITFESNDASGGIVYHTNVMMAVGSSLAVVCGDSIVDKIDRSIVFDSLESSGKEIIDISLSQMHNFCGNVLEVGDKVLAMSERAWDHFSETERSTITDKHSMKVAKPNIDNIEHIFGGGVRCMIAELFVNQ